MRRISYIIIIILSIAFIYSYLNYKSTNAFIEKLKKENTELSYNIIGELINKSDFFPKTKEDFKAILTNINNYSNKDFTFFSCDYGVRYDSFSRSTKLYTYNTNNEDDFDLKKVFYITDFDNTNYVDYLKRIKVDIVIFEIYEDKWKYDVCNIKNLNDLKNNRYISQFSDTFKIYYKNNRINEDFIKQFKDDINILQLKLNKRKFVEKDYQKEKTKTVFFRYKNNHISVLCRDDFSDQILKRYKTKIEKYISNIDKSYFDYAVFPITFIEDNF